MTSRRQLLLGLSLAPALQAASPANWPQFRGTGSLGTSDEDPRLPESWSNTENVAWKSAMPGMAWGSPVVWGDRIFVTNARSEGDVEPVKKGLYFGGNRLEPPTEPHIWSVHCLGLNSGKEIWQQEAHKGVPAPPRHLKNSFASETPVTDGEHIYAHFGHLGTYCYDMDGKLVWSKQWPSYKTRFGWGTASSPVIHEGRLYIVNDNDENSYLLSLDKRTGQEIWKTERDEPSNWSTPYVWQNGERTEIVTTGRKMIRSYDLDGRPLWELSGTSSIVIPTPFSGHGLLYLAAGYVGDESRPVYAVKPGAKGDITLKEGETSNEFVAWSVPQGAPYNPSPLLYGDHYYTLYDRGFLTCHDAKTGAVVYGKKRFEPGASAFTSSPWAYNGKVFCLSEDGDCFVIQAGSEYKLLRKNSLNEMCMATPAIVDGSLILRTADNIYRITAG